MSDNYLELTPDEALALFTSSGEFVFQLRNFCDSDLFFTFSAPLQEVLLLALDRHTKIYEKISIYLEKNGIPAMSLFEYDTKVVKPKGGI